MNIKLKFLNDDYILINLFNNTAVEKWFNKYSKIYNNSNCIASPSIYTQQRMPINQEEQWNIIKNVLIELKNIGYKKLPKIPYIFDGNQKILNRLHRFFTYNVLWAHDVFYKDSTERNPFDPTFKLPVNYTYNMWWELLDQINTSVHFLERITNTNNHREFVNAHPLKSLEIYLDDFNRDWLEFDINEQKNNYTFFDHQYETLVCLGGSILGKSLLRSFYDKDNPLLKDCTGRFGSFGDFFIENVQNRKLIYNSPLFKQWINDWGVKDLPYEFTIGYVSNTSITDFDNHHYRFKSIEFFRN